MPLRTVLHQRNRGTRGQEETRSGQQALAHPQGYIQSNYTLAYQGYFQIEMLILLPLGGGEESPGDSQLCFLFYGFFQ